jgi:hypothetical protein
MLFMDGTQKKNEIVEESYHTPILQQHTQVY